MLPPTAGPFTSAFFNPALATSVTFHCSGHTLLEYMQVYWLGPLTGKGPCGQQARPAPDSGLGRTHEAFLVDMPVVQLRGGESIQGLLAVASLVQMREMGGSFSVPARDPRRGGGCEWSILVWMQSQRGRSQGGRWGAGTAAMWTRLQGVLADPEPGHPRRELLEPVQATLAPAAAGS